MSKHEARPDDERRTTPEEPLPEPVADVENSGGDNEPTTSPNRRHGQSDDGGEDK